MSPKLILAAAMAVVLCTVSCAKDNLPSPPVPEETSKVYDLDLRFDAPADVAETTVYFFDGNGQQLAVSSVSVPASSAELVCASFVAEAAPEYLLTEGLQNVGENGLLPIPTTAVKTRSGDGGGLLLVIRH